MTDTDELTQQTVEEQMAGLRRDLWQTMAALNELIEALVMHSKVDIAALRRADEQLRGADAWGFPIGPIGLSPDYLNPPNAGRSSWIVALVLTSTPTRAIPDNRHQTDAYGCGDPIL